MTLIFKLPEAFVAQHRELLEAYDWKGNRVMTVSDEITHPLLERAVLEAVPGRGGATVIRSKDPRSMIAVRKYADAAAKDDE